jgi:hypothetical protein
VRRRRRQLRQRAASDVLPLRLAGSFRMALQHLLIAARKQATGAPPTLGPNCGLPGKAGRRGGRGYAQAGAVALQYKDTSLQHVHGPRTASQQLQRHSTGLPMTPTGGAVDSPQPRPSFMGSQTGAEIGGTGRPPLLPPPPPSLTVQGRHGPIVYVLAPNQPGSQPQGTAQAPVAGGAQRQQVPPWHESPGGGPGAGPAAGPGPAAAPPGQPRAAVPMSEFDAFCSRHEAQVKAENPVRSRQSP